MKKIIYSLSLIMISIFCLFLASCGGDNKISSSVYVGDNVVFEYKISKELSEGAKLSGSIHKKDSNSTISTSYVLAYCFESPFSSQNYSETILCEFSKENVESTAKFDLTLDLTKVFPQTSQTIYFVVRENSWDKTNLKTYSYSNYNYTWNNNKVKLS